MNADGITAIGGKYTGRTLDIARAVNSIEIPVTTGQHVLCLPYIISNAKCCGRRVPVGILLLHIHIADYIKILSNGVCIVNSENCSIINYYILRITQILGRCKVYSHIGRNIGIAIFDNAAFLILGRNAAPIALRCQVIPIDYRKVLNGTIVVHDRTTHIVKRKCTGEVNFHDNIFQCTIISTYQCSSVAECGIQFRFPVQHQIGDLCTIPQISKPVRTCGCLRDGMSLPVNLSIEVLHDTSSSGSLKVLYHHELSVWEHSQFIKITIIGNTVSLFLRGKVEFRQ